MPMSYGRLLPTLLSSSPIQLREVKALPTLLPLDYDLNTKCVYHSGTSGHSIENCKSFKYKLKDLIDSRVIIFTQQGLNMVYTHMRAHMQCHDQCKWKLWWIWRVYINGKSLRRISLKIAMSIFASIITLVCRWEVRPITLVFISLVNHFHV